MRTRKPPMAVAAVHLAAVTVLLADAAGHYASGTHYGATAGMVAAGAGAVVAATSVAMAPAITGKGRR